jgi:hypothetical protein
MNTSIVQGFDIGPDPHEAIILGNDHSGAGVETKMFFDRIRKGDRVGSGMIACRERRSEDDRSAGCLVNAEDEAGPRLGAFFYTSGRFASPEVAIVDNVSRSWLRPRGR